MSLAGRSGDVHFDLRRGHSNAAIRHHNKPGRIGVHTLTRRGSRLRRRLGLGHEPVEITAVDALEREHEDGGRGVGMHFRTNANQINVLGGEATMYLQPYQRRLFLSRTQLAG